MRILIVEDDEVLLEGLRAGLAIEGFVADAVETIEDARHAMEVVEYDAVVLDIALPDGSGLDLLHEWRRAGLVTPVLLLTARNAIRDRIDGLDRGADDYLGKPFDLDELAARIRAIGRRAKGVTSTTLMWRDVEIDIPLREVRRGSEPVMLSRREFAVLQILIEQPGRVFSRAQLEDRLYGWQEEVGSNAVEVHIHNLRAKLGRDLIETVRGEGYRVPSR
ncbi:response regulator [Sphingobium sp. YBL2]|uniref:response regulator n=1 Tax=Sphingobium sp. (strain YBL2) TaxID=484429 RepID=UPI0005CB8372|nr:response regulator [Sphingobium sp. YBL2]AJR26726.1 transcriptional regulator [Sphingobium sp. YBL2]